ncbi:hypothetical protein [Butyricimonas faecihominis]|jgi:hypothetical protein|uniref:hypothetical protein n=1 Tax=Butyricimonas faecihominis TaxID=1472416 RepID=UPI00266EBC17|nr:hypothetical protein [Butyricimonas faecihominis]
MKKYRRSFWAAYCVNSMLIPWIVGSIFCYLVTRESVDPSRLFSFYGFLFLGIPTLALLTYFFVSEFYVILSDDTLILKNAICPFWKKKVYYNDMVKVKIIYYGGGPSIPFMKIATTKTQRVGRYYLDRVRRKDFPAIIDFLREKGIEVYVEGMECFR